MDGILNVMLMATRSRGDILNGFDKLFYKSNLHFSLKFVLTFQSFTYVRYK